MKILVAYDKDVPVSSIINEALLRAEKLGASICLVRTCSAGTRQPEINQLESMLADLQDVFEKNRIKCETHVLIRGFSPGEDIVRYAREKQVDEIIIGIKKKSRVGKMVFGSNAQYIILEAHCPVLSVK